MSARTGTKAAVRLTRLYDWLEHSWESVRGQRLIGTILVGSFVFALLVIEIQRLFTLPAPLDAIIPISHFAAIEWAFSLLLVVEIIGLVFGLAGSVSRALGKQFEILSLILLRESFKLFSKFEEPLEWQSIEPVLPEIAAEAVGGLLIFVILGFYYQIQQHRPITDEADKRNAFIRIKKLLALSLLLVFIGIGVTDIYRIAVSLPIIPFFETFFTVLIFADILIVLVSLRYSGTYLVAFRNSGYAIATVFIRLALIAPPYVDVTIGVGAALFVLGLSFAYNYFYNIDLPQEVVEASDAESKSKAESIVQSSLEQRIRAQETSPTK